MIYVLIGLGGFVGAVLRYEVGHWLMADWNGGFPLVTLTINISGSFLLVLMNTIMDAIHPRTIHIRLAIGTGLLGAFTTFSALSMETFTLFQAGKGWLGLLYAGLSMVGGLLFAFIGYAAGKLLTRNKGQVSEP